MTASARRLDPGAPGAAITAHFVKCWSERYPVARERRLFDQVGPTVAAQGYYSRSDFIEVARWKSPRSITYVARNSDEDIEEITRLALAAPDRLRHRVLDLLDGVGVPMASALLTVCEPTRFTVIDYRAIETLQTFGELDSSPSYSVYLQVCRALAQRVKTDLRTLDRALWQWSKEHDAPRRSRRSSAGDSLVARG